MSQFHHRRAAHFYAASNNGMHPTRGTNLPCNSNGAGGRVMPGVRRHRWPRAEELREHMKTLIKFVCLLFVSTFFLPSVSSSAGPPSARSVKRQLEHPPGEFITVNGVKLWYESEGQGEPLLLVAGGPGFSHAYFHPFFSALADSYRVIYFDAFGCGKSERAKSAGEYSMARDVENIEAFRQALKLGKINLLGHSYGGFVAQIYAVKYPNFVRRLILANTLPSGKEYQTALVSHNQDVSNQFPEVWAKVRRLRAKGFTASSKELQKAFDVPGTLHNFYNPENARKLPITEPDLYNPELWYAIAGRDADFMVSGELSRFDLRRRLRRLKMPMLVLAGRFDRNVPPKLTTRYRAYLPRAEFVMFEKSGHFTFVEETNKTMQDLKMFLAK